MCRMGNAKSISRMLKSWWIIASLFSLAFSNILFSYNYIIVLDPGHGGPAGSCAAPCKWASNGCGNGAGLNLCRGAVGPGPEICGQLSEHGLIEAWVNHDVAHEWANLWVDTWTSDIDFTRDELTDDLSLSDRAAVANEKTNPAVYFVSVHHNSDDNHDLQGTETYYKTGSPASFAAANIVQDSLLSQFGPGYPDRGVKDGAGKDVLNFLNAGIVGMLTEASFISTCNEQEALSWVSHREEEGNG